MAKENKKELIKSKIKKTSLKEKVVSEIYYTKADMLFIEQNISTMKLTEMGVHLNRTFDSVRVKVSSMGLADKRIYSFKPYTAADVEFLQENVQKHTLKELVEMTGRTYFSVVKKLRKLNLKTKKSKILKE